MNGLQRIALIPAYEPESVLIPLLERLADAGFQIVVVDDGSGPDYAPLFHQAAEWGHVLTHDVNGGKGRALKTGLSYIAASYPADAVVVTVDADGQHTPEDAQRVCAEAETHYAALVLGSRSFSGKVPLRSKLGNTITRGVFRMAAGQRVGDTQTGLRAFSARWIPDLLEIPGDRYEYEMNMLLYWAKEKRPIREVEIATIYLEGNKSSHFSAVKDSARIYGDILKFAASSLLGFGVDYGMFALLSLITGGLSAAVAVPLSNITARCVSASVNYTVNRKLVFHSDAGVVRSATQYFTLAACILAGNTVLLSVLVERCGWNRYAAKLLTELTFFSISWLAQKFWIFRKKEVGKKGLA
jgi:glycosyltransferase involved in cell wall biosynthesis